MLGRQERSQGVVQIMRWGVYAALCASFVAVAGDAEAQRKGRKARGKPAAAADATPVSSEIASTMGDLRWGMSKDEVLSWVSGQVKAKYKKQIRKTHDVVAEDRLRQQMSDELRKIRESYVRFDGKKTGWDMSYLRDEFAHGTKESMLVVRDNTSQNHYFFINDRLWKWYKALDARVFQGKSFEQFAGAVQARFGTARERQGALHEGAKARQWLEWQDEKTRLRAIDQTQFYGFYCLVFEDKGTVDRLATLRRNAPKRKSDGHSVVDAVTSGDSASGDHAPDIVDRITGKRRESPAASRGGPSRGASGGRQGPASAPPPPQPASLGGVREEDDPLRGLDF